MKTHSVRRGIRPRDRALRNDGNCGSRPLDGYYDFCRNVKGARSRAKSSRQIRRINENHGVALLVTKSNNIMSCSASALISVVMPVHNGVDVLSRSISSLCRQSFTEWELLAIDDRSTDGSYESLVSMGQKESRIRVFRTLENRGPAAARNEGIRQASSATIAYLDCDDVYHPEYLEKVNQFRREADVLIFGYDIIDDDDPEGSIRSWDPAPYKHILFAGNLATPLGVAHRRDLALKIGGFDEELWGLEDWDLWKRFARSGAEFLFLTFRSGIYHKRKSSRSRSPHLTEKQRATFESRLASSGSVYRQSGLANRSVQKVLLLSSMFPFGSPDSTAQDLSEAAHLLSRIGFDCQCFCTSKLKGDREFDFERALSEMGLPFQSQKTKLGPHVARMTYTRGRRDSGLDLSHTFDRPRQMSRRRRWCNHGLFRAISREQPARRDDRVQP